MFSQHIERHPLELTLTRGATTLTLDILTLLPPQHRDGFGRRASGPVRPAGEADRLQHVPRHPRPVQRQGEQHAQQSAQARGHGGSRHQQPDREHDVSTQRQQSIGPVLFE